jgi:hypothetical protein
MCHPLDCAERTTESPAYRTDALVAHRQFARERRPALSQECISGGYSLGGATYLCTLHGRELTGRLPVLTRFRRADK